MAESVKRAPIRSYRSVLDGLERRIYRVDRWRLPSANGVSVRACAYAVGALVGVLISSRVPIIGTLICALPISVRLVALPIGAGAGLAAWSPDGRAPHYAVRGLLRHLSAARTLSGVRKGARPGSELVPLEEVRVAGGDGPGYAAGVVRGPARVVLRYPARIEVEGVRRAAGDDAAEQLRSANGVIVSSLEARGRAMPRAKSITIPARRAVRFR